MDSRPISLVLDVDGEGVVRVKACSADVFMVTPKELAELLTGLVKSICSISSDGDGEEVSITLN